MFHFVVNGVHSVTLRCLFSLVDYYESFVENVSDVFYVNSTTSFFAAFYFRTFSLIFFQIASHFVILLPGIVRFFLSLL